MHVKCSNCESSYELDSSEVNWDGVAVRCTNCGNLFRIKRPDTEQGFVASSTRPGFGANVKPETTWLVRLEDGEIKPCRKLKSLQMWIIAGRVTPYAEISKTGKDWKRLKELEFLTPFFDLAEKAKQFSDRDLPKVEQAADGSMIVHIDQVSGNPNAAQKPAVETLEMAKTVEVQPDVVSATSQRTGVYIKSEEKEESSNVGWSIAIVATCVAAVAGTLILLLLNKEPEQTSVVEEEKKAEIETPKESVTPHVVSLDPKEFENTSIAPVANIRGHIPIEFYDVLYTLDDEALDDFIQHESDNDAASVELAIAHAEKAIRMLTDQETFQSPKRGPRWKQTLKDQVYLSRKYANKSAEQKHPATNHAKAYADLVNGVRSQDIIRTLQDAESRGMPKGEVALLNALLLERDRRHTESFAVLDGVNNDKTDHRIDYRKAIIQLKMESYTKGSENLDPIFEVRADNKRAQALQEEFELLKKDKTTNNDPAEIERLKVRGETLDVARKHLEQNDYASADKALATLLVNDSSDPEALTLKGIVYQQQSQYVKAHTYFAKALSIDGQNENALWAKAETYRQQGLGLKAKGLYLEFLKFHPNSTKSEEALQRIDEISRE